MTNDISFNPITTPFDQTYMITINGSCKGQEEVTEIQTTRFPNQLFIHLAKLAYSPSMEYARGKEKQVNFLPLSLLNQLTHCLTHARRVFQIDSP